MCNFRLCWRETRDEGRGRGVSYNSKFKIFEHKCGEPTKKEQIMLNDMKYTYAKLVPQILPGSISHSTSARCKHEFIISCQFSPVEDLV